MLLRSNEARTGPLALAFLFLVLGTSFPARTSPPPAADGDWPLGPPEPSIPLRPERLGNLEEHACASCHTEVAVEWASSAHGLAWQDEHYRRALEETRRPESCHACHIPEPLLATDTLVERVEPRADVLEFGISCESCHLGRDGTMLGPRGTSVDAHPSRASGFFEGAGSNALCVLCHSTNIGPVIGVAKDFTSSARSEQGRTCVGCHMASVERSWASGAPLRVGRSHALQTPRDPTFLRRAFDLQWKGAAGEQRLVVENRAGHRVPGLVGRRIDFQAEVLDEQGAVLETVDVTIDERAFLPVDGSRAVPLTKPGTSLRVVGRHTDPRAEEPEIFLDELLSRSE